jgi:hypothetical protein
MMVRLIEGWIRQLKLGKGPLYGPDATVLGIVGSDCVWDAVYMHGVGPAYSFFIEKVSNEHLYNATLDYS